MRSRQKVSASRRRNVVHNIPIPNPEMYDLTFADEFNSFTQWNGTTGWTPTDLGGNRYYQNNAELQIYVDPQYTGYYTAPLGLNAYSQSGSILTLYARPYLRSELPPETTDYGFVVHNHDATHTSGIISSHNMFSQTHGYFELRAKLPAGPGLWPQFWLMPIDGSWPPEIDIFEVVGHFPTHIHQTMHYPAGHPLAPNQHYIAMDVIDTSDGFHNYGVLWESDFVTWYVDGIQTRQLANIYNLPMYIIVNLALKDFGNGNPSQITQWPVYMDLEYIRVYKKR